MRKEQILYRRGFRITESGDIINPKGVVITGYKNNGYITIGFRIGNKSCRCSASRIQAFQKYGNLIYAEGVEVRHFNGIKTDNSWGNILIGTASQNQMDIPESIRIARSIYASSFIKKHDDVKISEFHQKNGNSYKKTMSEFGISSKGTLHFILKKHKEQTLTKN